MSLNSISELKGKVLGCWCAPKLCHAQILHKLAGNDPIYQSRSTIKKMNMDSVTNIKGKVDDEMNSESFEQEKLNRELANFLQSMSDQMEENSRIQMIKQEEERLKIEEVKRQEAMQRAEEERKRKELARIEEREDTGRKRKRGK